jgi:hypothetical protein
MTRAARFIVDTDEPEAVRDHSLVVDSRGAEARRERGYRIEDVGRGEWDDHEVLGASGPGCEGIPGRFDIRADDDRCLVEVRVRIFLNPWEEPLPDGFRSLDPFNCPHADVVATPEAVRDVRRAWRRTIRQIWSRQYRIVALDPDCPCAAYDVEVDVQWAELGDEQHTVNVHSGCEGADSANWYMGMSNLTAAHEFGHLLGLDDEYTGSCVVTSWRSIMWAPDVINVVAPGTSRVRLFHYHHFAEWLSQNRPCRFEVGRIEDIPGTLGDPEPFQSF